MGYTVIFGEMAEKEFEALSPGRKKALFQKLKLLESDPAPAEAVMLRGYAPLRRIKAGDARQSMMNRTREEEFLFSE